MADTAPSNTPSGGARGAIGLQRARTVAAERQAVPECAQAAAAHESRRHHALPGAPERTPRPPPHHPHGSSPAKPVARRAKIIGIMR